MQYRFYTADVFTDQPYGGNPLAVLPDAQGLDTAQMQLLAREFNLSETVFVFPPADPAHTRSLRIFTPGAELPFAGHPTVGTAHVLAAVGEIALSGERTEIVFEEGVGPVPVTISARDGVPVFAQLTAARLPAFGPPAPAADSVAALLSLTMNDLHATWPIQAVSCGVPFLFVPLQDRAALARARLNTALWETMLANFWAPSVFPFTLDAHDPAQIYARMFAPVMGIVEDPATGAAATALAGYLAAREPGGAERLHWTVNQGVEMGRPSRLFVEAERREGQLTAIRVGGATVIISHGTLTAPGSV